MPALGLLDGIHAQRADRVGERQVGGHRRLLSGDFAAG